MLQIVQQRVLVGLTLEVALDVEFGVEIRRRVAPLLVAVEDEVLERIDAGSRNVLIGLQIILRVEFRDRTERTDTVLQIMGKRALTLWNAVLLPVPGRLKIRARPPPVG